MQAHTERDGDESEDVRPCTWLWIGEGALEVFTCVTSPGACEGDVSAEWLVRIESTGLVIKNNQKSSSFSSFLSCSWTVFPQTKARQVDELLEGAATCLDVASMQNPSRRIDDNNIEV